MYFSLHKEAIMDQINCSAGIIMHFLQGQKKIQLTMSTQTKPNGLKLKFLTSLQNDKENPPPPYFILRAHNIYKSTNSHFVLRMIKISRKEFKGCVDSDISISSVCWLTDQPYWCKKLGYTFYCKNICSQLTRINVKHKQI